MTTSTFQARLDRIGLPHQIVWGFVGLFFFILGTSIEQSWFSTYLIHQGFAASFVSTVFTCYGLVVTVAACLSGVGTRMLGVRGMMWLGTATSLAATVPLLLWALPAHSAWGLLVLYALRGAAYPLFAYSFLVWVNYRAAKATLGQAVSWFWIFFALGFVIVGPLVANALMPRIGEVNVIWSGLLFVLLGAALALLINRDRLAKNAPDTNLLEVLWQQLRTIAGNWRLGVGVLVKGTNDIGKFGFVIVVPVYLAHYGFSLSEWLIAWSVANAVNIPLDYLFGWIGDRIGWRKTVVAFSGTFCALSAFSLLLLPPLLGHNQLALYLPLLAYAVGMAGFCPLSAIIPSLLPHDLETGVTALNLGSGLSNLLGPAIVSLFIGISAQAVLLVIGVVFAAASVAATVLKLPGEA
ncbi:MFS transporter [Lacticaseibacillus kribbianus]|uniref:MFS transporter n=1 Tax=Lacticaseibacillus kribbianus TaxID=2926292 RepID=UPI001CD7C0C6|nr:MFS transporter [Lacticaseibacillus kribbianus]